MYMYISLKTRLFKRFSGDFFCQKKFILITVDSFAMFEPKNLTLDC